MSWKASRRVPCPHGYLRASWVKFPSGCRDCRRANERQRYQARKDAAALAAKQPVVAARFNECAHGVRKRAGARWAKACKRCESLRHKPVTAADVTRGAEARLAAIERRAKRIEHARTGTRMQKLCDECAGECPGHPWRPGVMRGCMAMVPVDHICLCDRVAM